MRFQLNSSGSKNPSGIERAILFVKVDREVLRACHRLGFHFAIESETCITFGGFTIRRLFDVSRMAAALYGSPSIESIAVRAEFQIADRPLVGAISALLPPRNDPPLLNISVSRDAVARQDCSNLRSYRLRIFTEERNERRETSPPRRVCYLFAQRVCPFNERSRSDASVVLLCSDTKNTRSLYY